MRNKIQLLSTLIFLSAFSTGFAQSNFFVSTSGDNSNSGTSTGQAWASVQYGLNQLNAGDTLNLTAGTYNEKFSVPALGNASNRITLRNHADDSVFIDGGGIPNQNPIIEIFDANGVNIQGLRIHNNTISNAQGILISGSSSHISILDNEVYDIHFSNDPFATVSATTNAQPIIVNGSSATTPASNLLIKGNVIRDCRTGYSEALAINGNVEQFEVSENTVHDITNIGIDIIGHEGTCPDPALDQARLGDIRGNVVYNCIADYATSGGIYVDGGKLLNIENNTVYHCGYGIEIGCEAVGKSTRGINVRNNIVYDNEIAGLALGGYDFPNGSGKVAQVNARNNTLLANDFSNGGTGELYLSYCDSCTIENNIFQTSAQNTLVYGENVPATVLMNFNLTFAPGGIASVEYDWNGTQYTGFSTFRSGTSLEANSLFSDPLLVSTAIASPDFHIPATSPARDKGNPATIVSALEVDIDGFARVEGATIDIGADEFNLPASTSDLVETVYFTLYPNPVADVLKLELKNGAQQPEYSMLNLQGQLLASGKFPMRGLDVSALPHGIYMLKLQDKRGRISVQRIVVQ